MYKNLNTPICVLQDALHEIEGRMDAVSSPSDLPALMAMAHELACIIDIRKDVDHLKVRGWCLVREDGAEAIITPEDIIIFSLIPESLLTYCKKIQNIAKL